MNREQIKHAPVSQEQWRPQRTQVGGLWFDPRQIKPLGEHILVELDEDVPMAVTILAPEIAEKEIGTRLGTVLAVGPGKLQEKRKWTESYMLNPLVRKPMTVKVGDRVAIGHYSDWESWFSDFEGRGKNVVLCQEADVRIVIGAVPPKCEAASSGAELAASDSTPPTRRS
jgi:co-chaperonin GroES (HSP10)